MERPLYHLHHQEPIYRKRTHKPKRLCVLCLPPERFFPSDDRDCPFGILSAVPQFTYGALPGCRLAGGRLKDSPECQGAGSGDLRVSPPRSACRGDLPLRCPLFAASPPCPRAVRLYFPEFYNMYCKKSISLCDRQPWGRRGHSSRSRATAQTPERRPTVDVSTPVFDGRRSSVYAPC